MIGKKPRDKGNGDMSEPVEARETPEVELEEPAEGDEAQGQAEPVEQFEDSAAAAISDEIREQLEELEDLRERHLRLAAEFENYRKRTRRELSEAGERGQAALVERLLDALDDLGRVADTPVDSTTVDALHEGVGLVERKLLKALGDAGLSAVEADGQPFDPNVHEALLSIPTSDAEEDDTVAQVLLTGYVFRDRLVRPAKVVVKNLEGTDDVFGNRPAPPDDSDGDNADSQDA